MSPEPRLVRACAADALQEATGAAGIRELQLMKDVGEVAFCARTKGPSRRCQG